VAQAAAPNSTLKAVLVVFIAAVVIILPSLGLLFVLDQKTLLPEESTTQPSRPAPR
jgi:cytochrome d ubiquinol oxidase subunit II